MSRLMVPTCGRNSGRTNTLGIGPGRGPYIHQSEICLSACRSYNRFSALGQV